MTKSVLPIDGILNVDKPYGITSMEVVRRIKRVSRQKRVGHGGTLDPVATGVIPVCLGQATRVMEYVVDGTKAYRATIELGIATDTYDSLGEVVSRIDPSPVTRANIERALKAFEGDIQQVPPMYSALKRQGKRLYDLARAGVEVEREPRPVKVYSLELTDWSAPFVTVELSCGRGFYMRSLAHDLGQSLGCGGHLASLIRLRSGYFTIDDAKTLEEIEEMFEHDTWQDTIHAPDAALSNMRAVILGKLQEEMIRNGRPLSRLHVTPVRRGEQFRAYSVDGRFLAVLKFDKPLNQWRPDKVFSITYPESRVYA